MNRSYGKKKTALLCGLGLILVTVGITYGAKKDYRALNTQLTKHYNSELAAGTVRQRGGQTTIEGAGISEGVAALRDVGAKVFMKATELVSAPSGVSATRTHVEEVIVQEFLRRESSPTESMPWLPLGWTIEYEHIEDSYTVINQNLENIIRRFPTPMNGPDTLRAYLFVGSVPHSTQRDEIYFLRNRAIDLVNVDQNFYDIRLEIHQDPTYLTLQKVRNYKSSATGSARTIAQEIEDALEALFGVADLDKFLEIHSVDSTVVSALREAQRLSRTWRNPPADAAARTQLIVSTIRNLDQLGSISKTYSDKLRTHNGLSAVSTCTSNNSIDCGFEVVDLLKKLQQVTFALGNNFIARLESLNIQISALDALKISLGLIRSNAAIGLMDQSLVQQIEGAVRSAETATTLSNKDFITFFKVIQRAIIPMAVRVRDVLNPQFEKYKSFVSKPDRLVDIIIRSSSMLPLDNFLAKVNRYLSIKKGMQIIIGTKKVPMDYRVLNPGIAVGTLIVPSSAELQDETYYWDPRGIYALQKTPAHLQKVAGILSAESGAMVSHVQLLASNLGLPNVFIPKQGLNKEIISRYKGKEIMIYTLPNGEATVKLFSNATADEIAIWKSYNKIKITEKVDIPLPRTDMPWILELESLRWGDKIAGGKAYGQGVLSHLFPGRVPRAWVVPFGVYHEHIRKEVVYTDAMGEEQKESPYDLLQRMVTDPRMAGTDAASAKFRRARFELVRRLIQSIPLDKRLRSAVYKVFKSDTMGFKGKGIFVRSDTNAEDLKEFVGAGLNKTVLNVRGENPEDHAEKVLQAIKTVWASPYTEKAYTWRRDMIRNPWDIYPSVILQIGVPSERAGVLIVGDPQSKDSTDTIFVAANEGLGVMTVNGEKSPEEIVYSRKTGTYKRLRTTNAKVKYVMRNTSKGGLEKKPVRGFSPIITESLAKQLAQIGDKVQKHMATEYSNLFDINQKWDLEFGIVGNKVYLFQVRPFIGNKIARDTTALTKLETGAPQVGGPVIMDPNKREICLNKNLDACKGTP